ncbi:hypothetical protein F6S87_08045 [Bifidobacterium sp. BRDM6]|uniref:SLH domain-containing protein n=1 Tax=Bifidobacterium choloepi TaxID=2614131 RepID=A0A6I5N9S0_9BIFI|nr:hypothetical protein [Bifidobacterium choloepi]
MAAGGEKQPAEATGITEGWLVKATVGDIGNGNDSSATDSTENEVYGSGTQTVSVREFRPGNAIVRQDMAAFLYRLAGSPAYTPSAADEAYFADVDDNTDHAREIWWCASVGITTGWEEKNGTRTFRGMNEVIRQDMAAFLHRTYNVMRA